MGTVPGHHHVIFLFVLEALTNLNGFFSNLRQSIESMEGEKPASIESKLLAGPNIHQHIRKGKLVFPVN